MEPDVWWIQTCCFVVRLFVGLPKWSLMFGEFKLSFDCFATNAPEDSTLHSWHRPTGNCWPAKPRLSILMAIRGPEPHHEGCAHLQIFKGIPSISETIRGDENRFLEVFWTVLVPPGVFEKGPTKTPLFEAFCKPCVPPYYNDVLTKLIFFEMELTPMIFFDRGSIAVFHVAKGPLKTSKKDMAALSSTGPKPRLKGDFFLWLILSRHFVMETRFLLNQFDIERKCSGAN